MNDWTDPRIAEQIAKESAGKPVLDANRNQIGQVLKAELTPSGVIATIRIDDLSALPFSTEKPATFSFAKPALELPQANPQTTDRAAG